MDFGKFKYEADMKARDARKNQANTVLKTIRLRLKIDPHDYATKKAQAEKFLSGGDKVKVLIMFRGREQSRPEMGYRLLQRIATDLGDLGFVESSPLQDGRNMVMVLGPHKKKAEAKAAARVGSSKARRRERDADPGAEQAPADQVEADQVEADQVEAERTAEQAATPAG